MYEPEPLRTYKPFSDRTDPYIPFEESGVAEKPSKTIFEEGTFAEYVVPFEYEKNGGSYRYGTPWISYKDAGFGGGTMICLGSLFCTNQYLFFGGIAVVCVIIGIVTYLIVRRKK